MKKNKGKYIYTNKKHSLKGIFATCLAAMSCVALVLSVVFSYTREGEAVESYAAVAFLCTVFSAIGILVGLWARKDEDSYRLFANIGIVWSVIDLLMVSGILYAGT